MTAPDAELFHDDDPGDPHAWQLPEHLADTLGVSTRTLRNWAARGSGAEKTRGPGGRTYYRATERPDPLASACQADPAEPSAAELRGEIARLQGFMVAQFNAERARLEAAHDRERLALEEAAAARVAAAEARAAGSVADLRARVEAAARDTARLTEERQRTAEALDLERERARLLERTAAELAAAPWYAFRRRRRARALLIGQCPTRA